MKRQLIIILFIVVLVGCFESPEDFKEPETTDAPDMTEGEDTGEDAGESEDTGEDTGEDAGEGQPPLPIPEYDVIIVGGGISGLTAAYLLQDYSIKVLEKNDTVGGRVLSGSYKGFTYAKGAEYIGEPYGVLKKIIRELGLKPREIPSPMDAHYYNKKFYYGEDAIALLFINYSSLHEYNSFVSKIRDYYDKYEWVPEFDDDSELADLDYITAREWFINEGFPDIVADRYNVAARGLFGATIDEISALSFIPEIAFDYEGSEPIRDIDDLEDIYEKGRWPTGAYSFERGITEVTEALFEHLYDTIQVNSTVVNVSRTGDTYFVTYEDNTGNPSTMKSKVVILAVPAPIALRLAPDILSKEQKEILEQISYASYATVALFSEEPIFDKAFDLAVPDNFFFTDVYDATWIQRYYDRSLRDVNYSIITVYCASHSYTDSYLLSLSDEEILDSIYKDLEKIFPGVQKKVTGYDIHRFPYAYPVMTLGAHHRLSRLYEITDGGLLLAGDYTIYPTFEAAVESGELAAEKAERVLRNQNPGHFLNDTVFSLLLLIGLYYLKPFFNPAFSHVLKRRHEAFTPCSPQPLNKNC